MPASDVEVVQVQEQQAHQGVVVRQQVQRVLREIGEEVVPTGDVGGGIEELSPTTGLPVGLDPLKLMLAMGSTRVNCSSRPPLGRLGLPMNVKLMSRGGLGLSLYFDQRGLHPRGGGGGLRVPEDREAVRVAGPPSGVDARRRSTGWSGSWSTARRRSRRGIEGAAADERPDLVSSTPPWW